MAIREKEILNAYKATGNYKDTFTVTHISSAAMSALSAPLATLKIKRQTFEIGGTQYKFVMDIASTSA